MVNLDSSERTRDSSQRPSIHVVKLSPSILPFWAAVRIPVCSPDEEF